MYGNCINIASKSVRNKDEVGFSSLKTDVACDPSVQRRSEMIPGRCTVQSALCYLGCGCVDIGTSTSNSSSTSTVAYNPSPNLSLPSIPTRTSFGFA